MTSVEVAAMRSLDAALAAFDLSAMEDATESLLRDALTEWDVTTIGTGAYRDQRARAAYLTRCLNTGHVVYPFAGDAS